MGNLRIIPQPQGKIMVACGHVEATIRDLTGHKQLGEVVRNLDKKNLTLQEKVLKTCKAAGQKPFGYSKGINFCPGCGELFGNSGHPQQKYTCYHCQKNW